MPGPRVCCVSTRSSSSPYMVGLERTDSTDFARADRDGPSSPYSDADLIIADDHYLALDLVLNAAGEGLILAFFHAIVGQSPPTFR